jgi:hypothetical protein
MRNGEGKITPEDLRRAAGVRSDGDAWLMAQAAAEIERLETLLRCVNVWQPIKTAPKDGTTIFLKDRIYFDPWHYEAIWNGIQWYHGFGTAWPQAKPTHWMPIPKVDTTEL